MIPIIIGGGKVTRKRWCPTAIDQNDHNTLWNAGFCSGGVNTTGHTPSRSPEEHSNFSLISTPPIGLFGIGTLLA